jgi:hypothetical protein
MQHARSHHHQKRGPNGKGKRAQANRRHRKDGNQPRGTHRIDQRPAGHLTSERHQSAGGQNKPDVELGPGVRRQIDRDERTEAGLDVGKEKGEPVKAARARARRRIARCGRRLLECRRGRKTYLGAAAQPTAVKFQC